MDDKPLYVFDYAVYEDEVFGQHLMSQYEVPDLFPDDLFQVVKNVTGVRPDDYYPGHR